MDQQQPDAEDVAAYQAGDAEALGRLYDRHGTPVFRYLIGMAGAQAAEDLLQETFLQASKSLLNYCEQGRLRQWLLSIARNKALDHLRRHKRQPVRALGDGEEESLAANGQAPTASLEDREVGGRIEEAVAQLPEMQRTVFLLREEGDLSYKEIATELAIPLSTALSHMHRAMAGLRKHLADLEAWVS